MFVIGIIAFSILTSVGLTGQTVSLSQRYSNRVLMRSVDGFLINWSTAFDHVALYDADGKLTVSYYPATAGLTFHRIADAAIQPDGGFVLGGTLAGLVGALVFVNRQGITTDVVRVQPGYLGKITRDRAGRIWSVGRSPKAGDANVVSVFSGEGRLLFTALDPKELPVPMSRLQLGATYLTSWRDSVLWVLPEHQVIFVLSGDGSIRKKVSFSPAGDIVTGAWTLGDWVLLALPGSDQKVSAVLEIDLETGQSGLRNLPEGGHPVGVFNGKLVRYSNRDGTVGYERHPSSVQ